jgi:hypothetical protein
MLTYLVRELRHGGFALGLDTQKLTSIDIDVRISIDYLFVKSLGYTGLPDDMRFMYKIYRPFKLQNMKPGYFVLLTRRGSTGVGTFPYHTWHKVEGEDILKAVGIDVEHGDELIPDKKFEKIGDLTHVKMMELILTGASMKTIGANVGRNHQSVLNQRDKHNSEVKGMGECQACKRARSPLAAQTIVKPTP